MKTISIVDGMKVTTQRTSKGAKLFMAVGIMTGLVGAYGMMTSTDWGLAVLLLGLLLWAIGKVSAWFFNE